jgi:hypothetical protein
MAALFFAALLLIDIPATGVVELPAGETHLARPLEIPKDSKRLTPVSKAARPLWRMALRI